MARRKARRSSSGSSDKHLFAVIGLLINVLFLPWLGTLIMKRKEWLTLLILWIVGFILIFTIIGIFITILLWVIAWIWGLIIGIQEVQKTM